MELDAAGNHADDIYQACGCGPAVLHIPQERLTAGEQHCALLKGEPACFVERGRTEINKVTHRQSSLVLARHCPGGFGDRLDDVVIAGAAADVALEFLPDRRFVRFAEAAHDIEPHHHHARRTVAALKRMVLTEGRLHRVEGSPGCGQTLNGCNHRVLALHREAVYVHDTGTALRRVAADMRAGQTERFPKKVDEHCSSLDDTVD